MSSVCKMCFLSFRLWIVDRVNHREVFDDVVVNRDNYYCVTYE